MDVKYAKEPFVAISSRLIQYNVWTNHCKTSEVKVLECIRHAGWSLRVLKYACLPPLMVISVLKYCRYKSKKKTSHSDVIITQYFKSYS